MNALTLHRVEEVLLDRVAAELAARGAGAFDRTIVLGRMLDALDAQEFETLRDRSAGPGPSTVDAERLLEIRLEQALAAGMQLACSQNELQPSLATPCVVVISDARDRDVELLQARLSEALERAGPTPPLPSATYESRTRGILLLLLGDDHDLRREKLAGLELCGRHVFVGSAGGSVSSREALRGIHVIGLPDSLVAISEALEHRLADLRSKIAARRRNTAERDPLVGGSLDGKFEIVRRIGRGTFGSVYEARDLRLGHRVAIKVLHPDAAQSSDDLTAFKNEARKLTRFSHPNVVDWKSFEETSDGTSYLVMEMLAGEELEQVLRREKKIAPHRAAALLLQIADALRAAHFMEDGRAVLHLDLKPSNVFVLPAREGATERLKVIDFGIGQLIGGESADTVAHDHDVDESHGTLRNRSSPPESTAPGTASGTGKFQRVTACTPEYAAPEQCAHMVPGASRVELDGRADIYALGAIAFRMLTGAPVFASMPNRRELLRARLEQVAPSVTSLGVRIPRNLASWVDRCLAHDREKRFRDAREAYEALARIVSPPLWRTLALPVTVATVTVACGLWVWWPTAGVVGLDVWADVDGVEQSLLGAPLYLGPARTTAQLRLVGYAATAREPRLRVVDGKGARARDLPGVQAVWRSEDTVELRADLGRERVSEAAYLEVASPESPLYSVPIQLVWIGEDAWQIESASIPERGERIVDPKNASLQIRVRCEQADLLWVGLVQGERRIEASAVTREPGESVYLVALDALQFESGRAELDIIARDHSERSQQRTITFPVEPRALRFLSTELEGLETAERILLPTREPKLRFALSSPADLAWTIYDESGRPVTRGVRERVEKGELVLGAVGPENSQKAIAGWVDVVAKDGNYVHRAASADRGQALARFAFRYDPMRPDLEFHVVDPRSGELRPLDSERRMYTSASEIALRVVRKNIVPVRIETEVGPIGSPQSAHVRGESVLVDAAQSAQDLTLALPTDGRYSLEVRGWRYIGDSSDRDGAEVTRHAELVRVSQPSRISLELLQPCQITGSTDAAVPPITMRVEEVTPSAGSSFAPLSLRWDLRREGASDSLASEALPDITDAQTFEFELPVPWEHSKSTRKNEFDGSWIVGISGTDAAGNAVGPVEAAYEVALDGPDLELVRPAPTTVWPRNASGRFELEVIARDPNDIGALTCAIHGPTDQQAMALVLERVTSRATDSVWRCETALAPSWSRADVRIALTAVDGGGAQSQLEQLCTLPEIDVALPLRIVADSGERHVAPMRLVRGNHDRSYVFGGRGDEQEEDLFRAAGLGIYNPYGTPKSWQSAFAAGEIHDYYLDEREVCAGEMLEFVDATDGWDDGSLWPPAAEQTTARREELARSLRSTAPDRPAADITWEEAYAYASWAGKRLPSWVEWEYALRGGTEYRPWAGWRSQVADLDIREINFDRARASLAPWPAPRGIDVTADTGIAHLSDNVAEWMATATGEERRLMSSQIAELVGSRNQERDAYWIAGGSFERTRFDFSVADQRPRRWHGPGVGFRCALSATELARAEQIASSRTRFRAETHDALTTRGPQ
jgi:serine/threonine protein kinase